MQRVNTPVAVLYGALEQLAYSFCITRCRMDLGEWRHAWVSKYHGSVKQVPTHRQRPEFD